MELDTTLKQKLRKHFPTKQVLAISGCLTLLGSIWSSTLLTRATAADYTLSDASVTLDGTNPGTATVSLKTAVAHAYIGLQGTWSLTETTSAGSAGTTYLALSGTSRGNSVSMPFGATNGNVIWSPEDGVGMAVAAGGAVLSATYTVDADTPEGEYMVSISDAIADFNDNGTDEGDDGIALLAAITVSRSSSDPTDPGTTDPDPGTTTDPDPTETEQTFTLTLNPNGGSFSGTATATCTTTSTSCSVTIPSTTAERSEYDFLGWADSTSATSPSYASGSNLTLTANKTLYAVWKETTSTDPGTTTDPDDPGTTDPSETEQTFTLTLNANSGSLSGTTTASCATTSASCSVAIPSVTPERTGYVFKGWADSASATSSTYSSGSSLTLTANKTLYAVWKETTSTDPGTTTNPDDPGTATDPGASTDPGSGTTDPGTSTDSGSTTNPGATTNPDPSASDSDSGTPTTLPKTSASAPNTGLTTKDNAAANQGIFAFFLVSTASTIVIFGALASQTLKRKSVRSFSKEN